MPKEAPSPRYVAALLAAAALILVVGSYLKPEPTAATEAAPAAPAQSEVRRLYRLSLRASVDRLSEYFSLVAGDIDAQIVRLAQLDVSGVVWDARTVIAAASGRPAPETTLVVNSSAENLPALTMVAGPGVPVVGVQLAGSQSLSPAARAESPPSAGQWILAAWRDESALRHTPGNVVGSVATACGEHALEEIRTSINLSRMMVGGGLFDMDGQLIALILECEGRPTAVSSASIAGLVEQASSLPGRLLRVLGLRAGPLTPSEASYFRIEAGLLVTDTWRGYPADSAGIRPGDVIVKLGGGDVQTIEDLAPLLQPPPEPASLGVRRGSRTFSLKLAPAGSSNGAGGSDEAGATGIRLQTDGSGFPIASVLAGSREARAGLRAGDVLQRIDFAEPRDLGQLRRLLSGRTDKPVFLEVERGERRLGLLIE